MIHQYTEQKAEKPANFYKATDYSEQFACRNPLFKIVDMEYQATIWYTDKKNNIKSENYNSNNNLKQIKEIIRSLPEGLEYTELAENYNETYSKLIEKNKVPILPPKRQYFDATLYCTLIRSQLCHGSEDKPCGKTQGVNIHCSICGQGAHIQCLKQMEVEINNNQFVCNNCNK